MKKKRKPKKSNNFLLKKIETNIGILVIITFALPLAIYANIVVLPRQLSDQSVEGITSFNSSTIGYPLSGTTTNTTPWHCPPGTMCYPNPSITPTVTCIPRPPCLDAVPRCLMAEPKNGWCPPTSPTPPQGCFYKQLCMMNLQLNCPLGSPNCQTCKSILVCPSGTPPAPSGYPNPSCPPIPTCNPRLGILCRAPLPCQISASPSAIPTPHCLPRPSCMDQNPACQYPIPTGGWCPPVAYSAASIGSKATINFGSTVLIYLNSFLRGLLGRSQ